jgi:acetolactate synthase-1/2/3 large subunit
MNVAELVVKLLEDEGVEYIFGVPGEENIDLMDALIDSKIKFILTRHETSAAFMAGAYGSFSGKPGVCLTTLGPGATNSITGVANSNMDRSPIVAITGQTRLDQQHKETHQYYDLIKLFDPITKWSASIKSKEIASEVIRKAFKIAASEKPGATHIELPEDIASMEVQDQEPMKQAKAQFSEANDEAIQGAIKLINQAKAPLILAGNGIIRRNASAQLRSFVEQTQIPVTQTFMGKGVLPWTDNLSLFVAGLGGEDYINCGFEKADLIITIGYDITEYPSSNWNPTGEKKVLHIDTKESEIDSHYPVEMGVIGEIGSNLEKIMVGLEKKERGTEFKDIRKNMLDEFEQYKNDQAFPIKPQRIIHDLRSVMDEDDIVFSDVGAHKMWLARMYPCYEPNTLRISNGLASMGVAFPSAIAGKLAYPNKKAVAVCGDGGFLMTGAELETAVRLKLPIIILLWRDGGYGLIEWKQMNKFNRSSHVKFENPDFVAYAKSFGAEGIHVEKAEDLKPALERALKMSGPVIIDCPVDYGENTKLTERLGEINC